MANTMANTIGRETAIVAPLFTKFTAERYAMHSTNLFVVADADYARDLKAKFLADAIPAESFAAGANALSIASGIGSCNFQSETPSGWPRNDRRGNPLKDRLVALFVCVVALGAFADMAKERVVLSRLRRTLDRRTDVRPGV